MENYVFVDALTGSEIEFDYSVGQVFFLRGDDKPLQCESIFFPGCSFINYGMPLVSAVYDTLMQHDLVDGISVLCCGKILSYEENGTVIRASFEEQLRDHVAAAGIKRIICACPNCVKALREAFALDPRTKDVELAVLPQVLADLGYRVDRDTTARLMKGDEVEEVLLCTHDSCPDREYGDFARGLRAILPDGLWVEPEHCWSRSVCCGSLPRAQGKEKQADKCADINGTEAVEVHADAIVTACMSCAFQLNMAQHYLPTVHFLELLYDWRIDWASVGYWMKLRFLFDETLGAIEKPSSSRSFAGLGSAMAEVAATSGVPQSGESRASFDLAGSGDDRVKNDDPLRTEDVSLSNDDVVELDL